jgi:hypothetical protein
MKNKIISVLLILIMSLSFTVHANAAPSFWASEEIKAAISEDLVPKELQKDYQEPITRAEFCNLAVNLYENILNKEIKERKSFIDSNDTNVMKIGGLGIVKGIENNKFDPEGKLTREQAAVILSNLSTAMDYSLKNGNHTFIDSKEISKWAIGDVQKAKASGIMDGAYDNKFYPKSYYTREESIATILRLYDKINLESVTEEDVYNSIMSLKGKYPNGTPWTNDNFYKWNGGVFSGGYGCAGFAFMLSDEAFGRAPARKTTDFEDIKIGDIIRLDNDGHSVIVTGINGDIITFAEGNYNSSVHWGRTETLKEIKETGTYVLTRYPE